ncbi:hypothetical protein [Streptomyces sp. NPDC002265]|uniref:hypothetical protein n=1 Tax=Streptomyces sp. NPDC002265 TaxID=3154415 RepID=UPI003330E07D
MTRPAESLLELRAAREELHAPFGNGARAVSDELAADGPLPEDAVSPVRRPGGGR